MHQRDTLTMDLQMIVPVAFDWDKDGDMDLICGDEDGRVAFIEHTGTMVDGLPQFEKPVYFEQKAKDVKFGALATPYGVDWDGDGDDDIICGNTAGYIGFFENLGGGANPKWDRVKLLQAEGRTIRIQAGPNGSIQGPAEAKWGYTTLTVADWDHDGLLDIVANGERSSGTVISAYPENPYSRTRVPSTLPGKALRPNPLGIGGTQRAMNS